MRIPKLPNVVKLGPGFVVPVGVGKTPGLTGSYTPLKEGGPVIDIDRSEPLWDQWETFGHELFHAVIDYELWIQRNIVAPLRLEAEKTKQDLEDE